MYETYKLKRLYIISAICLMSFSGTFLFMPISNAVPIKYARLSAAFIGVIFWITGILGYTLLIFIYTKRSKRKKRKIYIFSNKITAIADILFFIGIVSLAMLIVFNKSATYWAYLAIFITVLSWNIHWLFSRNYMRSLEKKVGGISK